MSEEAKTYVFGNDTTSAMLPALMNNGGFGCNGAWWVILLIALLGGRGFGYGNCGDASALIGQGMAGNRDAIAQLASQLNCDINSLSSALSSLNTGIQSVSASLGLTGQQVINAVQSGNATITSALQNCCCENRLLTTQQGYENRIAIADQTGILGSKIDQQSALITQEFCHLKEREMQSKIDALAEANSTLRGQIDNANQTAAITSYVNSLVQPLAATVNEIKAATPSTVTVPYPQLTAVPTAALYGYGSCGYYNTGVWA